MAFLLAGRLSDTVSPRLLVVIGLALFGLSLWMYRHVDVNTALLFMLLWMGVGRIGLAPVFPNLNASALRPLADNVLPQGSGIINFLRQLGGAFGVNVFTVLLARRTSFQQDSLAATQTDGNYETLWLLEEVNRLRQSVASEPISFESGFGFLDRLVTAQGSMLGFRDIFLVVSRVFFACLIPALFLDHRVPGSN